MAEVTNKNGFTLGDGMFLLFLGLKLTHQISWSWWWITTPIWAYPVFFLAVSMIAGLRGGMRSTARHITGTEKW